MTFHEKSRWIALVANLFAWGWYFTIVARLLASGGVPDLPFMMTMAVPVIVALTIIHILGHVVIAVWRPDEAGAPLDERDRSIGARATVIAYPVLSVGLMIAVGATLLDWSAFVAVNAVLLAFIVAETLRYGIEISAYRRMAA